MHDNSHFLIFLATRSHVKPASVYSHSRASASIQDTAPFRDFRKYSVSRLAHIKSEFPKRGREERILEN